MTNLKSSKTQLSKMMQSGEIISEFSCLDVHNLAGATIHTGIKKQKNSKRYNKRNKRKYAINS